MRPVGSDVERPFDVRIVAASNRDPLEAVAQGRLREDLYYRLAVVSVHLPPLREREDDLLLLARSFIAAFAAEHGVAAPELPEEFVQALRARWWAGNVRELRNELQKVWALGGGAALRADWLTPEAAQPARLDVPQDLASLEQWAIDRALERAGGNKAEAARALGIGRRTLYDKLAGRRRN